MWLATLNPGRPARRGRRKSRRLSAWQRKVKKYGGVMQAVKALRAEKRGRKKARKARGSRRRFRKNSFLTTALTSGGARVLMNAGRKRRRRKIRSRRSAVSRASVRGRSRRAARRSKMARKTRRRRHHRMPPRGRGGRFKSRTHRRRSRRVRKNPVLPISWNPGRRRRRRTRRNPLFLSRRGFSARKHSGYRQLHRRRRSPRYWHNPRRRRSYRRNPVLPISWNPAGVLSSGPVGAVVGRMKSFIDVKFWTETGLPAAAGYFGSKAAGAAVLSFVPASLTAQLPASAQPFVKLVADAAAGAGLSWAIGRFYDKKAGDAFWLGTVVNIAHSLLKQFLGGTDIAKTIGLDGLGDDLADRMRSEIARRVSASINGGRLNGMGSYLRTTNVDGRLSEYVTEGALRSSPNYSPGNALGDEGLDGGGF